MSQFYLDFEPVGRHGRCPEGKSILDTARVRPTILAVDLLLERDKHARRYIAAFRKNQVSVELYGNQMKDRR